MSKKIIQLNEGTIKTELKELVRTPYVYLDGIYLKRNWGGGYENVAVLIAMAS